MTKLKLSQLITDDERWEALIGRDRQAAGDFVYGVSTTGVYCRPGCSSKLPHRSHVRFFACWEEAEQAGFRACKRCTPNRPDADDYHRGLILAACNQIAASTTPPRLHDLANRASLSPYHFHRLFKMTTGLTPRQYYQQIRSDRLRTNLRQDTTVTEAMYHTGFGSSSNFYQGAAETLGMTPTQYRNGGKGASIRFTLASSYLGWVLIAATERGICAIDFGSSPEALTSAFKKRFPNAHLEGNDPALSGWVTSFLNYLQSPAQGIDLPLDIQGTIFQRKVWAALREIPSGTTATYQQVAHQVGAPKAVRAVARACASNQIAAIIPCHRVIRSNGGLGGYRWGLERKEMLLDHEAGAQK